MTVHRIERVEIIEGIVKTAAEYGLSLSEFYRLGKADELVDAELRDLWLIWGDVLD